MTETGGRDPLGLSRVSAMITDYLLSGIITQTSRARYYSFYPWCLWQIKLSEQPHTFEQFTRAFRRREAFMAISTLWLDPKSSVVGYFAVHPRMARYKQEGEVETNFKVLPSNSMGGYGQYYGGSLDQLGLTETEGGIDQCAPGRAEELAKAFDQKAASTLYCKRECFRENTIPLTVLEKSAEAFSLDALQSPSSRLERNLLRDLFFAWDKPQPSHADTLRRHTLGLVLDVAARYNQAGFRPSISNIDEYLVYPPYYYEVLLPDDKKVIPYTSPAGLEACFGFWKQFCVHEYVTLALEHLLTGVLDVIAHEPSGLAVETICEKLCGKAFKSTLGSVFGDCSKPCNLLENIKITSKPTAADCRNAQIQFGAKSRQSERAIINLGTKGAGTRAAVAVAMLSVLYAKWRNSPNEYSRHVSSKAGSNLWAGTVLPYLDEWLNPKLTWQSAFQHFIEPLILQWHDRVMYEKGKLESCWLHTVEGRVVKDQDYVPGFRASRHWNCARIMTDLGLLKVDKGGGISVTKEGRRALSKVSS